jgi:sugar lactone lactonase YvrE
LLALTVGVVVLVWVAAAGGVQPFETYEGAVARDEPLAQFRFGDTAGSGTIADAVGGYSASNHGIVLGGAGPFAGSGSGSFGGEAYASLPADPLLDAGAFTVEGWVDWAGGISYGQPLFDFGAGAEDFMYLTPSSSASKHPLLFEIHTPAGSAAVKATKALTASTWEYVAVSEESWEGAYKLTLYLNGVVDAEATGVTLTPASLGGSVGEDYLGRSLSGSPSLDGSLSNVAFYDTSLTAEQVKEHYDDAEFPVNTEAPSIDGTPRELSKLTAGTGTWTGLATIKYAFQWEHCTAPDECKAITKATKSEYTPKEESEYVDETLRVKVSASNSAGERVAYSAETTPVEGKPVNTGPPVISGETGDGEEAKVGERLNVSEGSWRAFPAPSFAYQWEACNSKGKSCTTIPEHATEAAYRVIGSELADTLRVTVTASNALGHNSAASPATKKVVPGPPVNVTQPSIAGEPREGQRLEASPGTWAGTGPIEYTNYAWQRCRAGTCEATGAHGPKDTTYPLGSGDVDYQIEVQVSAKNSVKEVTATSPPTGEVTAIPPENTEPPRITGEPRDGQTLSASSGAWTGTQPLTYSYTWEACETPSSCVTEATGATFRLGHSDVGKTIEVTVTAENKAGHASATSQPTATIADEPPSSTEPPVISGEARDGQTLSASTGEWEGTPPLTYTYRWEACETASSCVTEASGATFKLGPSDVGKTIQVTVTAENTAGHASSASQPTAAVAAQPPSNTEPPAISGEAKVGQTLSASTGGWEGTPPFTYTYQWESCNSLGAGCLPIPEATSSTYELAASDAGDTVRAVVTATNSAGPASSASEATAVVSSSGPSRLVYTAELGSAGSGEGQFEHPADVAVDTKGDVWVLDRGNDRVEEFNHAGQYVRQFGSGGSGEGQMSGPDGLAVNAEGDVWVLDTGNGRIEEFNEDGGFMRIAGAGFVGSAEGIAVGADGDVWVSATYEGHLVVFNSEGEYLKTVGSEGSGPGQLDEPEGLAVEANGHVWVAEWGNERVQEFTAAGEYVGGFGSAGSGAGEISRPYGIAEGDGRVLVSEIGSNRVQEFNEDGSFVERLGTLGSGPGQLELEYPTGLTIGSAEAVWIADSGNDRIEEWAPQATAPASTAAPTVSGEPFAFATLSASTGSWSGSQPLAYSYQWERCNAQDAECSAIEGATGASYTTTVADVGATLQVTVTASNTAGAESATSESTAVIGSSTPPSDTTAPSITGAPQEGQPLSVHPGEWTSSTALSYTYQWQHCNPHGDECEAIEHATGAQYVPNTGDLEMTVRVVVTASNVAGSAQAVSATTAPVEPGAPSELEGPSIAGSPREGETLVADPGSWGGSETDVSYQWERCNASGNECVEVPGASGTEYLLGPADLGRVLRVRVGASNQLGAITDISSPTELIEAAATLQSTLAPSISGTPQSGATLAASVGSWLGTSMLGYAYQWQSCDGAGTDCENIEGATSPTYLLGEASVGHAVRVAVTASDEGGSAAELSPATQPVAAAGAPVVEEAPRVSGTTLVGDTLTASTGTFSGDAPLAYSYRWERCGEDSECSAIEGATGSSYTLTAVDARQAVRVQVTASDTRADSTSAASPAVAVSPETLLERSHPYAAGEYHEGQTLSAQPGIWTGAGAIASSELWQRCAASGAECVDIEGASAGSYALQDADVGHTVRVLETVSHALESESAQSVATPTIGAEPTLPLEVLEPTLEGSPTVGQTLAAVAGSWAGSQPLAYAYQWQRCDEAGEECANIEGASGSSYALTTSDVGATIRVLVTASNAAGSAEAISYQSEVVYPPEPPSNTAAPEIDGAAKEGQELAASDGTWAGSRPLTYTRRWELCEPGGEGCREIVGATNTTYTPLSAEVGHTLRLYVTASNHLGSATARSAASAPVASAQEADVSEAVRAVEQSDPSLLASAKPAQIEGETVTPASEDSGEELTSSSAPTSSTISKQTAGELAVETPAGEMTLEPTNVASSASAVPALVNGTAAVFAETEPETDTIVRPDALGATTITQLRSAAAPTSFSWELNLADNQELEQLPDGAVAIVEVSPEEALEAPLEEAMPTPEPPSETTGTSSEETPPTEQEADEGEESSLIEPLPASPQYATAPFEPRAGEMLPDDTQATYETDTNELTMAQGEAGGTTLMVIDPPKALDSAGNEVPASLSVEGSTITMTLSPTAHTTYPVTAATHVASHGGKHPTPPATEYGLSDGHYKHFEESEDEDKTVHKFDQRLSRGGSKAAPLQVRYARLVLWWNTSPTSKELEKWLKAVNAAGLKPFITLGSCNQGRLPFGGCTKADEPNPKDATTDVDRYRAAFKKLFVGLKALHEKEPTVYPLVTSWGAWNEPDKKGEPLSPSARGAEVAVQGAEVAAYFWQAARAVVYNSGCHECRVVAGEFEDFVAHERYADRYVNTILHKQRYWQRDKPKTWGIHDYGDVDRGYLNKGNPIAKAFLTELPWAQLGSPREWISEAGVHQVANEGTLATKCFKKFSGYAKALNGPCKHQRLDAEDFLQLHNTTGRKGARQFERLYYYEYRAPAVGPEHSFDSALLEPEGVEEPEDWRPAYCVLAFHNRHCPPVTATKGSVAGTLTSTAGTVALTVNPYEAAAKYWVEYGTTIAYGQTTTASPVANEEGEQSETVTLTGLRGCTTYHYQAEAENESDEGEPSTGGDRTFTTACGTLERFAGTGVQDTRNGDGGPALDAAISAVGGLAVGADGSVYISEGPYDFHDIRRVSPNGIISTFAGEPNIEPGYRNGAASRARFGDVEGLAVTAEGTVYVADWGDQMLRTISLNGIVGTAAGFLPEENYMTPPCREHQNVYSGDGGPASEAGLGTPDSVAIGSEGSIYIGDNGDKAVRRISPDGTIETVAGYYDPTYNEVRELFEYEEPHPLACRYTTYQPPSTYSGDGGPATSAQLAAVTDIAVGPENDLYIAENDTVRKVDLTTGEITRFAGDGSAGYSGDGGPATAAELHDPTAVAVGPDGSVYIAEECNSVIRRVDPSGTITTVAGDGGDGRGDYGGAPTAAEIGNPRTIATDSAGDLFFDDGHGEVLEATAPLGPGSTADHGGNTCETGGGAS